MNPETPLSALRIIIRGGSWTNCDVTVLRFHRASNTPLRERNTLGFRTVLNHRAPVPGRA